ncbi:MAG: ATP-dependent Clp protease adaptor ClpS [Cellulosilyticaceae bacterium]
MESQYSIQSKNKVKVKKPKLYHVVMHNDDFTTMEFVIEVLVTLFNKKTEEAYTIMLDVHKKGKGVAGVYPYDLAITKANRAMDMAREEGFPFKMTVEEV